MYSNEFMKFLFRYQKEECSQKKTKTYQVKFDNRRGGKPAEILIAIDKK